MSDPLTAEQQHVVGDALIEQAKNMIASVMHFIHDHMEPAYEALQAAQTREEQQNAAAVVALEFGMGLAELNIKAGIIGDELEQKLQEAGVEAAPEAAEEYSDGSKLSGFMLPEGWA